MDDLTDDLTCCSTTIFRTFYSWAVDSVLAGLHRVVRSSERTIRAPLPSLQVESDGESPQHHKGQATPNQWTAQAAEVWQTSQQSPSQKRETEKMVLPAGHPDSQYTHLTVIPHALVAYLFNYTCLFIIM